MSSPQGQYPSAPKKQGRSLSGGQIGAGIAVIVGLVFVFENTKQVPIRFLFPVVTAPLWLALLITFLLGGAAGYFMARQRNRK